MNDNRIDLRMDVAHGQVEVERHGQGWYLVQLGRARYTKRFNISDAEARQLRDWLNENLRD